MRTLSKDVCNCKLVKDRLSPWSSKLLHPLLSSDIHLPQDGFWDHFVKPTIFTASPHHPITFNHLTLLLHDNHDMRAVVNEIAITCSLRNGRLSQTWVSCADRSLTPQFAKFRNIISYSLKWHQEVGALQVDLKLSFLFCYLVYCAATPDNLVHICSASGSNWGFMFNWKHCYILSSLWDICSIFMVNALSIPDRFGNNQLEGTFSL